MEEKVDDLAVLYNYIEALKEEIELRDMEIYRLNNELSMLRRG